MMRDFNRAALAVFIITVFNMSLFGMYVWLQITSASDGARLKPGAAVWTDEGVIVTSLDDASDGLQTDDVVVAVNGRSIESWVRESVCFKPFCTNIERPRWEKGQQLTYTVLRDGNQMDIPVHLDNYPLWTVITRSWGGIVFAIANCLIMLSVFLQRPQLPSVQAILVSASSLLGSMAWAFGLQIGGVIEGAEYVLFRFATEGIYLLTWPAFLHFALLFPAPHPLVKRFPRLIPTSYVIAFATYIALMAAAYMTSDHLLTALRILPTGQSFIVFIYLIMALLVIITNYRFQDDPIKRQQIRIVVLANVLVLSLAISLWLFPQFVLEESVFSSHTQGIIGLLMPLAVAVAILRYRLWDIEIIINRTLVYTSLTAIIVMVYVVIVGSLSYLLQSQRSLPISLFATGIVATLFQPLKAWLQQRMNRFIYGERDNPYKVLAGLGRRLETTIAADAVLPTIVETISQVLKLPYVAITFKQGSSVHIASQFGLAPQIRDGEASILKLPLIYQSEELGQLVLAPRGPSDPFTPDDLRLLEDISHQVGVAAHAVRLTADLQRSREQLVTTREEERRRLRRDLHDGLGPTLASVSFKLDAADNILEHDPEAAHKMIGELKGQIRTTLADIRRIAYNLRPPALDEFGLAGALREQIRLHNQLQVTLDVPETMPPLAAAVEVAVYRIVSEALTNVICHAEASRCVIRLSLGKYFMVEITDDGRGLPEDFRSGVGLASMRERAVELGGKFDIESRQGQGTRIVASLPLLDHQESIKEETSWLPFTF